MIPRVPRKRSNSGIYHVIIRGINKQIIFESDDDRYVFLSKLKRNIDGKLIYCKGALKFSKKIKKSLYYSYFSEECMVEDREYGIIGVVKQYSKEVVKL